MDQLDRQIGKIKQELVSVRKELHRIPEVGFQEYKTAAKVAEYLKNLGLEVQTGVAGTGVIALLRGRGEGPTTAIRACLDALAMDERSGVDYASEHEGVFHGCGHDGNMTFVLGAANILSQYKDQLKGNVKFIFQPAEEETGGAAAIIKAGGLKNPDVDAIVHLHNWPGIKEGVIAVKSGPVMTSSDLFQLEIIGTPGHGAWPHLAVDPVVVAADVISAFQNIISREIDPLKPAIITIGKIYGGTAVNIIPQTITLDGTVRTFDLEVRDFIQTRIEEVVKGVTQAARAKYKLTFNRIMPPVINDGQLAAKVSRSLSSSLGTDLVTDDFTPVMGCEEFSLFQQEVPGLFLYIGNDKEGGDVIPVHAPNYVFNDEILVTGVKALCKIVLDYQRD
ncbi:MAG TPA: M20 family metallopeptidase [Selenomonadales bacterium]|nr:M20 family metallopeptidase [Selenomonadales bacterium]